MVSYTVTTGESAANIASGLLNAIDNDPTLAGDGIEATLAGGASLLISEGPGSATVVSDKVTGAKSETVTLQNGGVLSGVTFTNVNNTIAGTGTIGAGDLTFVNEASGVIDANAASPLVLDTGSNTIANSGTLESTANGGLDIDSNIANSKTIEAGTGATVSVNSATITDSTTGVISASGTSATVQLDSATITGGKIETAAGGVIEAVSGTSDAINGATIASDASVEATTDTTLTLSGGTIGSGATVEALGTSATLDVSGTVRNSGTLYASGSGSLVDIAAGAVVNGGTAEVGDGIVEIDGASSEAVTFQSGGTGQLQLADEASSATLYSGTVSGFGQNTSQSIDLTSVTSDSSVSATYTPNATHPTSGGVLVVSSGSAVVADITLVGSYTTADFHLSAGSGGTVEITDPPVTIQNGNAPATIAGGEILDVNKPDSGNVTFAASSGTLVLDDPSTFTGTVAGLTGQDGLDLTGIDYGANTTLAYASNSAGTGGILSISDGTHTASIALLGSYIASSFATAPDGHGGTFITDPALTAQNPTTLTLPHAA